MNPFGYLTPDLTGVLEIADQLLFLRIRADVRLSSLSMLLTLLLNMFKLEVAFRVLFGADLLGVGLQAIILRLQQTADDGLAHRMGSQAFLNVAQTAIQPLAAAHGVACGVRLHQLTQNGL